MVATAVAPADFKTYQDRRQMSEDNQAIEDYKRNCEFHRLLRRYCGPNGYSVFSALQDRANADNDGWCWPSYETIMDDTGIGNRNAITTALELLFDLDLIEWQLNGRHAIYRPIKKLNSIELILFQSRAQSYQNDTKDSIKTVRSIVSKRYSNVNQDNVNQKNENESETLDTDVSNGAAEAGPAEQVKISHQEKELETKQINPASESPPPDRRGFKQRWREAYEAVKDDPKARSGVMAGLWTEVTGLKPDYKQLNGLARQYSSMWKVMESMCELTRYEIVDDPLVFLRKVLSNGQQHQQQRGPYLGGNGGQQQLEHGLAYSRTGRAIKPRGSDPGGRLTEAELSEGYQS